MQKPLVIDLYCGLGGWSRAFLDEGWEAIGFDIERHDYGSGGYPGQLVLQDVCSLHGAQLAELKPACIVASSPCQEFSYRAMPWKRAKALPPPVLGINLFWQAFRIQQQLFEELGYWVPLVAENVRGAQPWVGRARASFGSFFFWGDIEQVGRRIVRRGPVEFGGAMLSTPSRVRLKAAVSCAPQMWKDREGDLRTGVKGPGGDWFKDGRQGQDACAEAVKVRGLNWNNYGQDDYRPQGFNVTAAKRYREEQGVKQGGSGSEWFDKAVDERRKRTPEMIRQHIGQSRKAASAQIAMIPYPLAQHVARIYKP